MTFWRAKRVLVTGCSGLIGAPMCKMLFEAGADVTGYDLDTEGILGDVGIHWQFPVIRGDILNADQISAAAQHKDIVIHLAAISHVECARAAKAQTFRTNVLGTLNVLEACRPDVQAVVVASSNHVYGQQRLDIRTLESAQLRQVDTYSVSKIMLDYLARAYSHNYGLPTAVMRNTNCYGPFDPHQDHIIPGSILSILAGRPPEIRSSGRIRKGYLYVDDVARAYLKVAEHTAESGQRGLAYNVASKETYSALELVKALYCVMPEAVALPMPVPAGQVNDQADEWLDTTLIESIGWTPQETLESGLLKTADGIRARSVVAA